METSEEQSRSSNDRVLMGTSKQQSLSCDKQFVSHDGRASEEYVEIISREATYKPSGLSVRGSNRYKIAMSS